MSGLPVMESSTVRSTPQKAGAGLHKLAFLGGLSPCSPSLPSSCSSSCSDPRSMGTRTGLWLDFPLSWGPKPPSGLVLRVPDFQGRIISPPGSTPELLLDKDGDAPGLELPTSSSNFLFMGVTMRARAKCSKMRRITFHQGDSAIKSTSSAGFVPSPEARSSYAASSLEETSSVSLKPLSSAASSSLGIKK